MKEKSEAFLLAAYARKQAETENPLIRDEQEKVCKTSALNRMSAV
jgi:hypothetical protein